MASQGVQYAHRTSPQTYELLTGQDLFKPVAKDDLTAQESLLQQQYALTGETFSQAIVQQSAARAQYLDNEGNVVSWIASRSAFR